MPPQHESPSTEPHSHPAFDCNEWPLHYACRVGNLNNVKYLVHTANLDVNEADDHDATPLYLAALTGSEEICQFLLENGAKCDPEGDAARVFYVALTNNLRRMLRAWSLSAATRDPFLELLRKSFNDSTFSDCRAVLPDNGETVHLHRAILQARCPSLLEEDQSVDDSVEAADGVVTLTLPEFGSWRDILQYIYTGNIEMTSTDTATNVLCIAKAYQLDVELIDQLQSSLDQFYGDAAQQDEATAHHLRFRGEITNEEQLRRDLRKHAKRQRTLEDPHASITITCGPSYSWKLYPLFLCSQSDYFDRGFQGGFREAEKASLDLSHLVSSPSAVQLMLDWMHCGEFLPLVGEDLSVTLAVDILSLGSAILCPRLCAHTANAALIPSVSDENAFFLYGLSKQFGLDRLEDKCVDVIARHIDDFCESDDLVNLLFMEVSETTQKGDEEIVDVPLAAEIRSCIHNQTKDVPASERARRMHLLQVAVDRALLTT